MPLKNIIKQIKQLALGLKEKPEVSLEDFQLEHIMLYHALAGTSPDNQKQFQEVRADIFQALERGSSDQLCIALKLPPLMWKEKLEAIFGQIKESESAALLECLLPDGDGLLPASGENPLRHSDWRVRANAAYVLAFLQKGKAVPSVVRALVESDSDESVQAAFCHLSYALAALGGEQARSALTAHLTSRQPWHAVDAAGALAFWPLKSVGADLSRALLAHPPLADYMSVAISRRLSPLEFLGESDELVQEGALELILGILQAAGGSFGGDTAMELLHPDCLARVFELLQAAPSPRRLRTMLALASWLEGVAQADFPSERSRDLDRARDIARRGASYVCQGSDLSFIFSWLEKAPSVSPESEGQAAHAIKLCGQLALGAGKPYLIPLLKGDYPLVEEVVEALGALSACECAPLIVGLIEESVDLDLRTAAPLDKYPVFEESPSSALIYWTCLKALGKLPHDESVACLLKAVGDFAPDKRRQALESLIEVGCHPKTDRRFLPSMKEIIAQRLGDPAITVKQAALAGVACFHLAESLEQVIRLSAAAEVSLRRQALDVLSEFCRAGARQKVVDGIKSRLSSECNQGARRRLQDALLAFK